MKPKSPTSIRLTETAKQYLKTMADEQGISQSAILETAIRKLYDTNKIYRSALFEFHKHG